MVLFKSPPITELVIDLHFRPLQKVSGEDLAGIRNLFRKEYPHYEEQPNIGVEIEPMPNRPQSFFVNFGPQLQPLRRQWYSNSDQTRLFQFQQDRFIANWRPVKGNDSCVYPSFSVVFKEFISCLHLFQEFLHKTLNEDMHFVQWEITKLNLLELGQKWQSEIYKTFSVFSDTRKIDSSFEGLSYAEKSLLFDGKDAFGKLQVSIDIGDLPENKKIANLRLTAKGPAEGGSLDSCLKRMERANTLIDDAFVAVTTDTIRFEKWGQK
jgi:uncharacterized protein (TIGR04255 family)